MCYGDCNCFLRAMRNEGMTDTESRTLLNELRDKVDSGELEPEEALASAGLDNRFLLRTGSWSTCGRSRTACDSTTHRMWLVGNSSNSTIDCPSLFRIRVVQAHFWLWHNGRVGSDACVWAANQFSAALL